KDTAVGEVGTAITYARSDHTHHVKLGNSVPKKDTGTGTGGTSNVYSSATHQHPLNIDPTIANVPLVNATAAANGTSDYYCRNDHVHPQQLTYDGNVTATKFIKTGGLASEILCANGETTTLDNKLSRTYNSSGGGWIRLCVFPAGASVGNPFIKFKVYNQYNAVQTIRLVPYYTVNGINTIYGVFTAPTKVSTNYVIDADNRGLAISADGNTLTFNGSVIAGAGATNGASNGSVNYSAGNPILWGVNSVDTNGGFYSDGPKIYWRAKPVTLGAVPP
ncbi:MAG: hypothetical protein EZS28_036232, partial [Streblomastix strix]